LIGSLLTIALGAWAVGGIALGATLIVSAWVQIALHEPLHRWHRQRNAIVTMLGVAHALARTADRCAHPLLGQIGTLQRASGRLLTLFDPGCGTVPRSRSTRTCWRCTSTDDGGTSSSQELQTLRTLFRRFDIEADLLIKDIWHSRLVVLGHRSRRQLDTVDVVNPLTLHSRSA
jgi:hypothetical protein